MHGRSCNQLIACALGFTILAIIFQLSWPINCGNVVAGSCVFSSAAIFDSRHRRIVYKSWFVACSCLVASYLSRTPEETGGSLALDWILVGILQCLRHEIKVRP